MLCIRLTKFNSLCVKEPAGRTNQKGESIMLKVRVQIFALCAAVLLVFIASATANAQWNMADKDKKFFTNSPCSNPFISWALWGENGFTSKPAGGIDCNTANY